MAHNLFELPPDRGRAAMARLLTMAAARGLAIEIVALADTASFQFDIDAHVRELGQICARAGLCTIEIANEPIHATQDRRVHDPKYLAALRRLIPADVPCSLGLGTAGDAPGAGDYVTAHFPRDDGWKHVAALAEGFALRQRFKAPVINDEPIGAATQAVPGSRDADPERFRAAALLSQMAGLGATFHYDGGLQAIIPAGHEDGVLRGVAKRVGSAAARADHRFPGAEAVGSDCAHARSGERLDRSGRFRVVGAGDRHVRPGASHCRARLAARGEPRLAGVGALRAFNSAAKYAGRQRTPSVARIAMLRRPARARFSVCPA